MSTDYKQGDLLFLMHPGNIRFSGFGLVADDGRPDHLVGLIMVDRPRPVSKTWLARIALHFGAFQLFTMSSSGERGLACQMWIEAESMAYIQPIDTDVAPLMQEMLFPFLLQPPAPQLDLRWDSKTHCWHSKFHRMESPDLGLRRAMGAPLFSLGMLVATPGAMEALENTGQKPGEFLRRHVTGDWGEVPPEDAAENERALKHGSRLFSAYLLKDGTKIWVITEWDRSVTTILLPSEY